MCRMLVCAVLCLCLWFFGFRRLQAQLTPTDIDALVPQGPPPGPPAEGAPVYHALLIAFSLGALPCPRPGDRISPS